VLLLSDRGLSTTSLVETAAQQFVVEEEVVSFSQANKKHNDKRDRRCWNRLWGLVSC
jgi:hypothetical protein